MKLNILEELENVTLFGKVLEIQSQYFGFPEQRPWFLERVLVIAKSPVKKAHRKNCMARTRPWPIVICNRPCMVKLLCVQDNGIPFSFVTVSTWHGHGEGNARAISMQGREKPVWFQVRVARERIVRLCCNFQSLDESRISFSMF